MIENIVELSYGRSERPISDHKLAMLLQISSPNMNDVNRAHREVVFSTDVIRLTDGRQWLFQWLFQ